MGSGDSQDAAQELPADKVAHKLGEIQHAMQENGERLIAIRDRLVGRPDAKPEEPSEARTPRDGMIGQLHDQADVIYRAVGEQASLITELQQI